MHENQLSTPQGKRLLTALRKVCAQLPDVEEVVDGFGHTTFRIKKKSFVIAGMGEEGGSISIKCDGTTQAHLIKRGPYYRTPYIGQHGWVSVANPLGKHWQEIQDLIADAYALAAPKRRKR
jgi:predicted DNA-binding protein (MmcQ/YjbR family)